MDVTRGARPIRLALLIAGLHLAFAAVAHADPMYTAIDLGTGSLTYGVDSSGNGTVTGSNGQTYIFNPAQNYLPSQWANTTVGVPIVQPAPVGNPDTYGNPNNAYSYGMLSAMNGQGLASGINAYGVYGHFGWAEAFITQQQANGSWGSPIALWPGSQNFGSWGTNIGITGVSADGQVLGYGVQSSDEINPITQLFLYDTKTHALTNLTDIINAMLRTNPTSQTPYWLVDATHAQFDEHGRILVPVSQGVHGPMQNLLLIPESAPPDQVPAPEPAAWATFALLIGGWMAHGRIRAMAGR
jgi:hypothetical protein